MNKSARQEYRISRQMCKGKQPWSNVLLYPLLLLLGTSALGQSVSGNWDAAGTTGTTGYHNYGSGVIRLLDNTSSGCAGAAIHETSDKYDPASGTIFNKCYQAFFGCPGNDNIGSDSKGDGLAFSFSKCAYNINNGLACGGGLGYMGSCAQMFTIEFDTWSSQCGANFDCNYGGGTSGNNDEIAIHINGDASDAGRLTSVNAGNLEDGLEHTICINYNPTTRILQVRIDGNLMLSYTYDLLAYFGAGGLNQTWSSGKFGATNPATVSDGASITSVAGTLCPSGVHIVTPANGASFGGCTINPITITASATPPPGNSVNYVEFFVNGVSIGTDNTSPYSIVWASPTIGNHSITARAYWSLGGNTTSAPHNITVGGGIQLTSTPPVIDGTREALWNSYPTYNLNQGYKNPPDLDAFYKIMYDANFLYVLVDVTDEDLRNDSPNDWEDDGVEIYIDIGNNKLTFYAANDYQYVFEYNSGGNATETKHCCGSMAGVTVGRALRPGGYVVEARFPWPTLGGTPTPGTFLGFDVKINDDDGGGGRDHELAWNDGTFNAWNNPSLFGTLEFYNCNPLPVNLINFTAIHTNNFIQLDWATLSELNADKFIVQRSLNGMQWQSIATIEAKGNSTSLTQYSFTDSDPLHGYVYYRLMLLDTDNGINYSNTLTVYSQTSSLKVWPNPFDHTLLLQAPPQSGPVNVEIFDMVGKCLFHSIIDGLHAETLVQPELSPGQYLLSVKTENQTYQTKIIKK